MTARQLFEYSLIELNKVQAPSLLLEDYNYFINKAINQYINKVYNVYDINQQKSDDLRVLKATAVLAPTVNDDYEGAALFNATYEVDLPDDYLHILNCVVEYTTSKPFKCYDANSKIHFGAKRLTADMFSQIINNYYMRPSYKNPYFYINNVSDSITYPISNDAKLIVSPATKVDEFLIKFGGTPGATVLTITKSGVNFVFNYNTEFTDLATLKLSLDGKLINAVILDGNLLIPDAYAQGITNVTTTGTYLTIASSTVVDNTSLVEKVKETRYGNRSKVRMEIRYGKDDSVFTLSKVYIDYLKAPLFIRLTQTQVDEVEDKSQLLEFPDYVCQEITNELIKLLMENSSDPRLQTNIPINQSIANPAQEQQAQQKR